MQKKADFLQENANISKIKTVLVLKVYFLELHMGVYLRTNFQVSSIILTSFRQRKDMGRRGGGGIVSSPTTLKRAPKKPIQIRIKACVAFVDLQQYLRMSDLWYYVFPFYTKHSSY